MRSLVILVLCSVGAVVEVMGHSGMSKAKILQEFPEEMQSSMIQTMQQLDLQNDHFHRKPKFMKTLLPDAKLSGNNNEVVLYTGPIVSGNSPYVDYNEWDKTVQGIIQFDFTPPDLSVHTTTFYMRKKYGWDDGKCEKPAYKLTFMQSRDGGTRYTSLSGGSKYFDVQRLPKVGETLAFDLTDFFNARSHRGEGETGYILRITQMGKDCFEAFNLPEWHILDV